MFGTATDTAENLMKFAAGPAFLGIAGLITYATKVLGSDERSSKKGWFALAAGIALVLWLAVFVAWASSTVLRSWRSDEGVKVQLVLLSATWFVSIGTIVAALLRWRSVARYLTESYHSDGAPWLINQLRRLLGTG